MQGLTTIKHNNQAAVKSYPANTGGQTHILSAPTDENFDYRIPWHFANGVLHIHVHNETKVIDVIQLKKMVAAQEGPRFTVEEHLYS